jgi:hypothetical protein
LRLFKNSLAGDVITIVPKQIEQIKRQTVRSDVSAIVAVIVILVSNRNTSRRVWEKLSDQGESNNAR